MQRFILLLWELYMPLSRANNVQFSQRLATSRPSLPRVRIEQSLIGRPRNRHSVLFFNRQEYKNNTPGESYIQQPLFSSTFKCLQCRFHMNALLFLNIFNEVDLFLWFGFWLGDLVTRFHVHLGSEKLYCLHVSMTCRQICNDPCHVLQTLYVQNCKSHKCTIPHTDLLTQISLSLRMMGSSRIRSLLSLWRWSTVWTTSWQPTPPACCPSWTWRLLPTSLSR